MFNKKNEETVNSIVDLLADTVKLLKENTDSTARVLDIMREDADICKDTSLSSAELIKQIRAISDIVFGNHGAICTGLKCHFGKTDLVVCHLVTADIVECFDISKLIKGDTSTCVMRKSDLNYGWNEDLVCDEDGQQYQSATLEEYEKNFNETIRRVSERTIHDTPTVRLDDNLSDGALDETDKETEINGTDNQ